MKFKVGDKVKATEEYVTKHEKAMEFLWGEKGDSSRYSNMTIVDITTLMDIEVIYTTHTAVPWIETQLEFINPQDLATRVTELAQDMLKQMTDSILSVQPMPSDAISNLLKISKTEDELKAEGYEPVSNLGLLWMKKEDE
jgi:hypothetical protein